MAELEERIFPKGANQDDELRSIPNGDYIAALNISVNSTDGSSIGIVKNIKGNVLIQFNLPAGNNKTIGTFADKDTQQVYYFVFNDLGNHGIYRFSQPNIIETVFQDPILGFTKDLINHANLVDGKLLYWSNSDNPPRKINIQKALENKQRVYNIYFGTSGGTGETYSLKVTDPNGVVSVFGFNENNTPKDAFQVAKDFVNYFPSHISPSLLIMKAQGAYVQVTFTDIGQFTLEATSSASNQVIAVAQNFYPKPYVEDFIDRLKYPQRCEPKAVYKADPTIKTNLVQNRIFQFCTQYIYDDDEHSTLSPFSVIPAFGNQCSQNVQQSTLNYIEVDFTEDRLNDLSSRSIIKYVNVYFREHNDGKWKLIKNLQPFEFGININGLNPNILKFYNDGIYKVLDDETATTLFSSVPIISGATEFIGNRLVDSNFKEGYDNIPIDADLSVKYNTLPKNVSGFSIKGRVNIVPVLYDGVLEKVPICNVNNESSVFGGMKFTGSRADGVVSDLTNRYFQHIPLNGFVFYLAGTDYYGISKQNPAQLSVATQDSITGVVNIATPAALSEVGLYDRNVGFSSDFEINGVPAGIYSLRIASHLTTDLELVDGTRGYQRSSTTVCTTAFPAIQHFNNPYSGTPLKAGVGDSGKTEVILEVIDNGNGTATINVRDPDSYNILYTMQSGDRLAESWIEDISVTAVANSSGGNTLVESIGMMGYIVDSENKTAATLDDALGFERVTRTSVTTRFFFQTSPSDYTHQQDRKAITDHNGFYFSFRDDGNDPDSSPTYTSWKVMMYQLVNGITTTASAFNVGLLVYGRLTYPTTYQTIDVPYPYVAAFIEYLYTNSSFTANNRTFIDGFVLDINGNPVSGINVVIPYHGSYRTGSDGKYSISFYACVGGNLAMILASSSGICFYNVSIVPQLSPSIIIDSTHFNNITHLSVPLPPAHKLGAFTTYFTALFVGFLAQTALKRGGDWEFGLVYYDRGLRSGTVNNNEKINLHILFYSEPDPTTGNIANTGVPDVSWEIKHLPPDWAVHYQWVRTKNLQLSFQLEFTANAVRYVNVDFSSTSPETITSYALAQYVAIDLNNIQAYLNQNASSLLAYTWNRGDRIRFIKDANGNYFNQYYDFEIVNQNPATNTIYFLKDFSLPPVASGVFFEIYTPRLNVNDKLFYEMGECFEVGTDAQGRKFHKGLSQDQDPMNPNTTPATGTFRTGDAWYRLRSIPYKPATATLFKTQVVDDQSVSDFYLSKDDNIGRINILNLAAQQLIRERTLRYSLEYIQDSKINNLSWNREGDWVDITKGEGSVNKLQAAGRNLLSIQGSQVNTVYINETEFLDASGNSNVAKSDTFIGSVNPLKKLVGTIHPESIKEFEGEVYGYDGTKGIVWRYANDGLEGISDRKFISYFKNKAQNFKGNVFGFINPKTKEYGVTFIEFPTGQPPKNNDTVLFCDQEQSKRWISQFSYLGENYSYSGVEVISFQDGNLWVHERNNDRGTFYGVHYPSKITVVSNENNSKLRNFIGIVVDGSDVWYAENFGDISIPPSVAYPQGMSSRLLKNKFRRVGTDWYSPFMKDINTPNKSNQLDALVNGRDLIGHVIVITLTNDSTDEVTLKSVGVRYLINEFTKK